MLAALLLLSGYAHGHQLQLFAMVVADRIEGRVYFSGDHAARAAHLTLSAADNRYHQILTVDAEGRFQQSVTIAQDYSLQADSGDGHRAEWTIQASEFGSALAGDGQTPTPVEPAMQVPPTQRLPAAQPPPPLQTPLPSQPQLLQPSQPLTASAPTAANLQLRAEIERALATQLQPLREQLQRQHQQTRFKDIVGGLGYILGLAGLALWFNSRRQTVGTGASTQPASAKSGRAGKQGDPA